MSFEYAMDWIHVQNMTWLVIPKSHDWASKIAFAGEFHMVAKGYVVSVLVVSHVWSTLGSSN